MTTRIAVLAQDLIWADRLARIVEAIGAAPQRAANTAEFGQALDGADAAIIDLTARAYDPLAEIAHAAERGVRVLAVGPHDDVDARKQALAQGADKVLAYRKLAEDGPATLERWLAIAVATPSEAAAR